MPLQERRVKKDIDQEPRHEAWDCETLKRFLAASCLEDKPGVVEFEKLPRQIDLGYYAQRANTLRELTDNDPEHRERGVKIIWDPNRNRLMSSRDTHIIKGEESGVTIPKDNFQALLIKALKAFKLKPNTDLNSLSPEIRSQVTEYIRKSGVTLPIGDLHSHPTAGPFSEADVASFLTMPREKISIVTSLDGIRAMIATRTTKKRNPRTSQETDQITSELKKKWEDRVRNSLRARSQQDNKPDLIQGSKFETKKWQFEALFALLAQEEGFGYYKGDHSGVVRRLVPKRKK